MFFPFYLAILYLSLLIIISLSFFLSKKQGIIFKSFFQSFILFFLHPLSLRFKGILGVSFLFSYLLLLDKSYFIFFSKKY